MHSLPHTRCASASSLYVCVCVLVFSALNNNFPMPIYLQWTFIVPVFVRSFAIHSLCFLRIQLCHFSHFFSSNFGRCNFESTFYEFFNKLNTFFVGALFSFNLIKNRWAWNHFTFNPCLMSRTNLQIQTIKQKLSPSFNKIFKNFN